LAVAGQQAVSQLERLLVLFGVFRWHVALVAADMTSEQLGWVDPVALHALEGARSSDDSAEEEPGRTRLLIRAVQRDAAGVRVDLRFAVGTDVVGAGVFGHKAAEGGRGPPERQTAGAT
jgi:hypothetical protein